MISLRTQARVIARSTRQLLTFMILLLSTNSFAAPADPAPKKKCCICEHEDMCSKYNGAPFNCISSSRDCLFGADLKCHSIFERNCETWQQYDGNGCTENITSNAGEDGPGGGIKNVPGRCDEIKYAYWGHGDRSHVDGLKKVARLCISVSKCCTNINISHLGCKVFPKAEEAVAELNELLAELEGKEGVTVSIVGNQLDSSAIIAPGLPYVTMQTSEYKVTLSCDGVSHTPLVKCGSKCRRSEYGLKAICLESKKDPFTAKESSNATSGTCCCGAPWFNSKTSEYVLAPCKIKPTTPGGGCPDTNKGLVYVTIEPGNAGSVSMPDGSTCTAKSGERKVCYAYAESGRQYALGATPDELSRAKWTQCFQANGNMCLTSYLYPYEALEWAYINTKVRFENAFNEVVVRIGAGGEGLALQPSRGLEGKASICAGAKSAVECRYKALQDADVVFNVAGRGWLTRSEAASVSGADVASPRSRLYTKADAPVKVVSVTPESYSYSFTFIPKNDFPADMPLKVALYDASGYFRATCEGPAPLTCSGQSAIAADGISVAVTDSTGRKLVLDWVVRNNPYEAWIINAAP